MDKSDEPKEEAYYEEEDDEFNREEQARKAHPYRKYQLWILLMFILTIILSIMLFNLNSQLTLLLKIQNNLQTQVVRQRNSAEEINALYDQVEVNYKSLYNLDKQLNIDIVKDLSELSTLSSFITENDKGEVDVHYTVCFKGTQHGQNVEIFRSECSGISPLIFLVETTDGYRFGGYTALDFGKEATGGFRYDSEAFLFSFDTMKKYKVTRPENAIGDVKGLLPYFGNNDIFFNKDFMTTDKNIANNPTSYEMDDNAPSDYFLNGGVKRFRVKEIEVLIPFKFNRDSQ